MSGLQIHPTSIHLNIRFGGMLESYYNLQLKLKTAPKLTDAL